MRKIFILLTLMFVLQIYGAPAFAMTPQERTVELIHEPCGTRGTATNAGAGFFLTNHHMIADNCKWIIQGQVMSFIDSDRDSDWAIIYNDFFEYSPDVETAPIVVGETCWFWRDDVRKSVFFVSVDRDGNWMFGGDKPIAGDSGSGIFNAEGKLVALVNARIACEVREHAHFFSAGLATAVLGLLEKSDDIQPIAPPAPS